MTIAELIEKIYNENYSHFDFIFNMNGGECDCNLHQIIADLAAEEERV